MVAKKERATWRLAKFTERLHCDSRAACLLVCPLICSSGYPQNQTLPGCTGTRKQQDPDAAAPRGLWERSLSGRGISFHDSVSAALPESQKWEVGGKEMGNQWLGWQEHAQGPLGRARCYFLLCLLPGWFQLPLGKVMRSRVFFCPSDPKRLEFFKPLIHDLVFINNPRPRTQGRKKGLPATSLTLLAVGPLPCRGAQPLAEEAADEQPNQGLKILFGGVAETSWQYTSNCWSWDG